MLHPVHHPIFTIRNRDPEKHTQLRRTHGFSASQGFSSLSSFPSTFSAFLFDGLATVKNTFQQQNNGNSARFKTKLFPPTIQFTRLLVTANEVEEVEDYELNEMIYLLTFFTQKWRIWMIEAILSRQLWMSFATFPGPPAPCLEDVAGVACDTGAGAASSTSPWGFKQTSRFFKGQKRKTMQQQSSLSSLW